ncbi:MAG: hypothetical protein NT069_21590, partial [Planctomycetota bacterium]|nr:hypothetical protein [Planctomycetota bacterium]
MTDYGVVGLELPAPVAPPTEITEFADGLEVTTPGDGSPACSGLELVEFLQSPEPSETSTYLSEHDFEIVEPEIPKRWLITRMILAVFRGIGWLFTTLFGIASLIVLLAVVAAIPIVNFLALGYLLEVEGRVARSGRLRDAFPLLALAPRLGSIALGLWLCTIPLRMYSHFVNDAHLIDPGSPSDAGLQMSLIVVSVLAATHMSLAVARGGTLGCFFRPLKNVLWIARRLRDGDYWETAEREVANFVTGLRLKHHFLLGVKGFVGALAWLLIPTALFAAASKTEGPPILVTLFGGFLLVPVLLWVPFLQAHLAAENRLGAMFELKSVRELYKHAPFSWLITILITLLLALPMYLFKAAMPPRDALWLVTIVFVVSIYPAKVLTGWAYYRATHREKRTHWLWRWICWLPSVPLTVFYVFLLYFTQFIGKYGKLTLFEHHSFL